MKRADGKPLSKAEVIVKRRGAFIWLPVLCSNDLVHGSWSVTINSQIFYYYSYSINRKHPILRWFTWGSLVTTLFAIYPLVNNQIGLYHQEDDLLPATDYDITWAMLIISGTFFTFGSLAFVHAFEVSTEQAVIEMYLLYILQYTYRIYKQYKYSTMSTTLTIFYLSLYNTKQKTRIY